MKATFATLLVGAATAIAAQAQTFTILASFPPNPNGFSVFPSTLVQGADGNFYGTTTYGGIPNPASSSFYNGQGTIFKITPTGTLTTLYRFGTAPTDGAGPDGLIQAGDGNFYGATCCGGIAGAGTIFEITPQGTLTTLYSSSIGFGGLILGTDGNFYGLTGGPNDNGAIFKLTPAGTLTTLCSFGAAPDDISPVGLTQGTDGNFYEATFVGGGGACPGAYDTYMGCGAIFKITPTGTETILYSFGATSAAPSNPQSGLIQATDGNFYGTAPLGGLYNGGLVYKVTPEGALTILYSFGGTPTDGRNPDAMLIQAIDGNFYGTTENGGVNSCPAGFTGAGGCGTIFKVTPSGTESVLYSFSATESDGQNPPGALTQGTDGNFYGTTNTGGTGSDGMVFKFIPAPPDLPAITTNAGVLNGASLQPGIAPGSWITILGTNLASTTDTWANAIVNGNFPTALDGVSVMVGDLPAYIAYVSPTQINAVAPSVAAGTVPVTVTTSIGTSPAVMADLQAFQPAFFQWGDYAVATRQDFSPAVKNGTIPGTITVPAKPGDVIILWGTGFGPTSPSAPVGGEVPSGSITYNTANAVSVTVGGNPAMVYGAALASGYAGLYQVAVQIPASLANGDYPMIATVSGAQSPSTTLITVQQ
jgi:uncharacterized protein (TIGR03437 family)